LIRHRENFSFLRAFAILPDKTALFARPPLCMIEFCVVCIFVLYLTNEINSNSLKAAWRRMLEFDCGE